MRRNAEAFDYEVRKMIHVVVVEDELLVRLGTKICIEDYQNHLKVDAMFESAEDAENYFVEKTADILVTDIRLTKMNGLELIRKIRPEHLHMGIIVLSCYEDFSYARESMELGVDRYLLKHELTGDDLPRIILEVYESGKKFQSTSDRIADTERNILPEIYGGYSLGYLVLRGKLEAKNSGLEQIDFHVLREIVQELLDVGKTGVCFLRHEEELFIVFHRETAMALEEFKRKIELFYERMSRNLMNYFNKNTFLFHTREFEDTREIKSHFMEAKEWSLCSFYYEESHFFEIEDLKKRCGREEEISICWNPLAKDWIEESKKEIERFFFKSKMNLRDVGQVKADIVKYFYKLESLFYDGKNRKQPLKNYHDIDAFDSAALLKQWLLEVVGELQNNIYRQNDQIEKIGQYILEHYTEDMSLEKIASEFHMSAAYFSQYFKKKKGISFVSYINEMRISKARELLKDPDLSAEEAAIAIGIHNPNYFIRLFKKVTGQTVGEYRKDLK